MVCVVLVKLSIRISSSSTRVLSCDCLDSMLVLAEFDAVTAACAATLTSSLTVYSPFSTAVRIAVRLAKYISICVLMALSCVAFRLSASSDMVVIKSVIFEMISETTSSVKLDPVDAASVDVEAVDAGLVDVEPVRDTFVKI